ncbi:hypothetical protein GSI_10460 [Ganoderma sinense ZZ0214-1]|uniref:Uncharacterized protein n=1 Tax=Ganoderma sinense ZZ0214-1 TaxID=1077348 RepID=A0A2G8S0L4_9APHY|nr:hypothetical protein GSI_10460 [Ganoderma sinense ZZ0214-1]
MPPAERKSALFQPVVPKPPQTILSLETELSYFRPHRPLLLETELRPFSLRNHVHPYLYPIGRRGGTPDRDCLDWTQYPPTPAVAAAIRRITATVSPPPSPPLASTRARSRQPTPSQLPAPSRLPSRQPTPRPGSSRQSTPLSRQPTPGPPGFEDSPPPQTPNRRLMRRAKSVRFPSEDEEDGEDNELEDEVVGDYTQVLTPGDDDLISKPDGEVGRHRRGYSLPVVLGWPQSQLKRAQALVKSYVQSYLDHSYSSSHQPVDHVTMLTDLIVAKHPGLVEQYRDGWPIRDMIYLRLKYTSSRFREGQRVPQGKDYPQDLKKALKEIRTSQKENRKRDKGKQRAKS